MHKPTLIALAILTTLATGCKHTDDAAKQQGAELAKKRIQEPIENARAATAATDKLLPAVLDGASNVYHKPGCKNADASTMETTTVGAAMERGAKPDPACFPAN